jgi:DNA-binding transcriptional regulator GbsR (MarR family)
MAESRFEGPFTVIFGNPAAKVLDQSLIVGNMEQTISMLVELTDLSYKTVQSVVKELENVGFMKATRKIGNAQAYRFEMNDLHELLECAQNIQIRRLNQEING